MTTNYHEQNRQSWNEATKQHHSHKPDLIEQYKNGRNNLYPEENQPSLALMFSIVATKNE